MKEKCFNRGITIRISVLIPGLLLFACLYSAAAHTDSAAAQTNAATAAGRAWMNTSLPAEQRAKLLLGAMTLDEKINMVHGVDPRPMPGYVGYVPAIPRLGIPALRLADGRAGVGNGAKDVTLLPAPICAAATWDTDLLRQYGEVLGREEWGKGSNVALAPSMDVVRVPEWGRTFESYGEDPYMNAQMAVAEIQGIQSQGPIANANMYLTMNQEDNRFKEDSVVGRRTLHEIYLPPFEAAVERGGVGTVMCAYVKTNGVYSCESQYLLEDLLKKQLGFRGWVMSDWGATHSTVAAANGGLDQEMPGGEFFGRPLKAAVQGGQVAAATLDEHVLRILATMFRFGLFDKRQTGTWDANVRTAEHTAFSRKVAEEGAVLLKNEGAVLPMDEHASIAVIGAAGSVKPKAEGGGSSGVVAPYVVTPLAGIQRRAARGARISYAQGNDPAQAAAAARAAQIAVVFVSTDETEGRDRPDLKLPRNQDALIAAVAQANPNTIVVLDTGGSVLMPWIGQVRGLIEAWYPGQEDGNAIAALLYGDVNPSGKLTLSFPRTAAEIPTAAAARWPGVNGESSYSEKLEVGYRWYDSHSVEPLFPFGYGLSYTTFRLAHLSISPTALAWSNNSHAAVRVTLEVSNTGHKAGAEVVQVYVAQPASNGEPPRQLAGFARVELNAGSSRQVTLTLQRRAFSIYDEQAHAWKSPGGRYEIFAGTSSRDLPLHGTVKIGRE